MPEFNLSSHPHAYGHQVGMLLLNLVETHVPGDTANALTYKYPVLFKVVEDMHVEKVAAGDPSIEAAIVAAAKELENNKVKVITSNCGFMVHYQDAVRAVVNIPVFMSSLLQLPMIARSISSNQKIAILTAFKQKLTPQVLSLAGLPDSVEVVTSSIETTPEFLNMADENLDTDEFQKRLEEAAAKLFTEHSNIGALLFECAVFTPYAAPLQRKFNVPVYDFVSLIDYAWYVNNRNGYPGVN